jgi:hypothetical protein
MKPEPPVDVEAVAIECADLIERGHPFAAAAKVDQLLERDDVGIQTIRALLKRIRELEEAAW